jgi:hypothetical protein
MHMMHVALHASGYVQAWHPECAKKKSNVFVKIKLSRGPNKKGKRNYRQPRLVIIIQPV